jgi:plasmid stabilization system protein ParE
MPYTVLLLEEAVKDIEAIYRYLRKSGNKNAAKDMVLNIRKACDSLSENPERGHIPDELSQIGQFEYRQIIAKKYRIQKNIVLFTNSPNPTFLSLVSSTAIEISVRF